MEATSQIARWIVNAKFDEFPIEVIDAANASCFDTVGVIIAGSSEELAPIIIEYAKEIGGVPESSVLGTNFMTSAPVAALVNATLGHAMDFDNTGGFGHPATVLFPSLLGLAEKLNASGRELLEAYIVGCEVGFALYYNGGGIKNAFSQMQTGFHATSVFGRIAAAAACAKLFKLDHNQTMMTLGIAGSLASGLVQNFGSMTKALHAGVTSRDGIVAAQLACKGWTASADIIEHRLGFMKSFFGESPVYLDRAVAGLGKVYLGHRMFAIKKYPTCGHNDSMLESLINLMKEHHFTYDEVERIDLFTGKTNPEVLLFDIPRRGLEGKWSLRYNAAAALVNGTIDASTFREDGIKDGRILEIIPRINLVDEGTETTRNLPLGTTPVRVHLKNSKVLERSTAPSEVEGSAARPMAQERLIEKFKSNCSFVLDASAVDQAVQAWINIRHLNSISVAMQSVCKQAS